LYLQGRHSTIWTILPVLKFLTQTEKKWRKKEWRGQSRSVGHHSVIK
jgi:hypothetical protein